MNPRYRSVNFVRIIKTLKTYMNRGFKQWSLQNTKYPFTLWGRGGSKAKFFNKCQKTPKICMILRLTLKKCKKLSHIYFNYVKKSIIFVFSSGDFLFYMSLFQTKIKGSLLVPNFSYMINFCCP